MSDFETQQKEIGKAILQQTDKIRATGYRGDFERHPIGTTKLIEMQRNYISLLERGAAPTALEFARAGVKRQREIVKQNGEQYEQRSAV